MLTAIWFKRREIFLFWKLGSVVRAAGEYITMSKLMSKRNNMPHTQRDQFLMHKTGSKENNKRVSEKSQKQRSKVVGGVGSSEEQSMPSQKDLLPENLDDGDTEASSPLQQNIHQRQRRRPKRPPAVLQPHGDDDDDDDEDSEGIDPADLPEFICVDLEAIRDDFKCAICLDIIKNTRTVMGCLHRFCEVCIEKLLRVGKKRECPTCRLRLASRRSLREDPNYDKLIAIFFPDNEKNEEQELSSLEEAKALNKELQASIAQSHKRQSDALTMGVKIGGESKNEVRGTEGLRWGCGGARSRTRHPSASSRQGNRNGWLNGPELSFLEEAKELNKQIHSSIARIGKSQSDAQTTRVSPGGESENEVRDTERLSWGCVGARSQTRHQGAGAGASASASSDRSTRLNGLVNYL